MDMKFYHPALDLLLRCCAACFSRPWQNRLAVLVSGSDAARKIARTRSAAVHSIVSLQKVGCAMAETTALVGLRRQILRSFFMLFRKPLLPRIARGEITLAFRCWKRPSVRAGGQLQTQIGLLNIISVQPCVLSAISDQDAKRAGVKDAATLVQILAADAGRGGQYYRVAFNWAGEDPRVELREQVIDDEEGARAEIERRLRALDSRSNEGPWTRSMLSALAAKREMFARDLAAQLAMEQDLVKRRVRQLKNLGLTESQPTGYRLSARGRSFLAQYHASP